jgi:hypothetical protein
LHVTRSEIDLPPDTDPYSPPAVYDRARENLRALRAQAPLVVEDEPSLYLYRLRMDGHEQVGVAGCFSVDEYESDAIRKHERTRRDKEDDRTRHIVSLRAQTGVVFLTYRRDADVDRVARGAGRPPLFDFTADDGVQHTVWVAPPTRRAGSWTRSRASRAVHRRRAPPRRERRARARRTPRQRTDPGRRGRPTRSSPWRSLTARCRSSRTTGR